MSNFSEMENEYKSEEMRTKTCENKDRENWSSKTEFILSCMGYAIGIGNIWRFPYLCYRNGGGAFLIPYLLVLVLCGIPLFFLETSLGQFASTGCVSVFRICPLFKGAGYTMVVVSLIVSVYFNTLCAYPLVYLIESFQWKLPWADCSNSWNTENCIELTEKPSLLFNFSSIGRGENLKTPADEFFHHKVLQISSNVEEIGGIVWPLFFCNALSWTITYFCIMKGVKSVGKVVYFTATFPFVVLFVFLIRGITLPGAWDGIYFYVYPQWDQLSNIKVWAEAAMQIFFSLGPGWGGMITMASFNKFNYNHKYDSLIVPLANSATSITAGFVVFSVIGFMANKTNKPVATVATSGPGLAFITYPEAISLLPMPHLWAVLFFLMLFFLGIDTLFVQIEGIINGIIDEHPKLKKHKSFVTLFIVIIMAALSTIFTTTTGMYWLQLFDWYATTISVILVCIIEVVIVSWIYGVKNFTKDIEFMINDDVPVLLKLSWKTTTPVLLLFIFIAAIATNKRITYHNMEYPDWAVSLGWCSCAFSICLIPLYMGYRLLYLHEGDLIERFKSSSLPDPTWGPANFKDRVEWAKNVLGDLPNCKGLEEADPLHEKFVQLCTLRE